MVGFVFVFILCCFIIYIFVVFFFKFVDLAWFQAPQVYHVHMIILAVRFFLSIQLQYSDTA